MTEILTLGVALFVAAAAVTLCLAAVLAPRHVVRARARALLLAILRGKPR